MQGGFRRGYSTLTQVAVLHHALSTEALPIAVLLDLEAAYDKVREAKPVVALTKQLMPQFPIHIVTQLMFTSAGLSLAVNGVVSAPISRDVQLPQSSPLSPIVFNKFIDSLVLELNTLLSVPQISSLLSCLFFADDDVLMYKSWKNTT